MNAQIHPHQIAAPKIRRAREDDATDVVFWFSDRPSAMRWGGLQIPDPLGADWLAAQFLAAAPEHYAMIDDADRPIGVFGLRFHDKERRAQRLTLNVYGSNDDARAAYERAGFFPYEFAKAREDPSGLMVRMLKPL